jgi:hypothetical protein
MYPGYAQLKISAEQLQNTSALIGIQGTNDEIILECLVFIDQL